MPSLSDNHFQNAKTDLDGFWIRRKEKGFHEIMQREKIEKILQSWRIERNLQETNLLFLRNRRRENALYFGEIVFDQEFRDRQREKETLLCPGGSEEEDEIRVLTGFGDESRRRFREVALFGRLKKVDEEKKAEEAQEQREKEREQEKNKKNGGKKKKGKSGKAEKKKKGRASKKRGSRLGWINR